MYAQVNGLDMYYEVHGTGRPLVVLHGGMQTIDLSFAELLPALSAGHQVIAVELQGHGHTADIDRDPVPANLATDVVALLDQLGVERADFVGYSLGGLVSLTIATTRPERVGRLVLASTQFRKDGWHDAILAADMSSPRMATEQEFGAWHAAYCAVAPDPDHFWAFNEKLFASVLSVPDWTDEQLTAITAPTLLVLGDNDFIRLSHAVEMHELIPDAGLAVLPNTRHTEVMGRTDLLLPLVTAHLGTSVGG